MARPKKVGLDYFPLDVNFDQDDKVIIIIGKYGMEGLGVLIKLMMELYRNGYHHKWTEREQIVFSSRINVDINLVNEIVNDCIKWGFFNKNMYDQHQILTSKGFQERYVMATNRRLGCEIAEEYKLYFEDAKEPKKQEKPKEPKEPEVKKPESKSNANAEQKKIKALQKQEELQEEFERFWIEYPRKTGKKPALKAFTRWRKDYELEDIIKGVKAYAAKCKAEGTLSQYIKHPSTFLNEEAFTEIHEIESKTFKPYKSALEGLNLDD